MFEIGFGVVSLFVGLMLLLYKIKMPKVFYLVISPVTVIVVVLICSYWLPRKLKEKFIWGKAGYSIGKDCLPNPAWVFLGLSLLSGVFAIVSFRFLSSDISILLIGFTMFFAFISQFFQAERIRRFLVLSVIPLFVAGGSILLDFSFKQSIDLMVFVIGFAFIVSGVIVYRRFVRKLSR
jgi:hypothetical protein